MMINLINIGFDIGDLTINAFNAIIESDVIINYDNIDLTDLDSYVNDKEIIVREEDEEDSNIYSEMKKNYSLIELAISKSSKDNVTIIASNNQNIYGIANLLIQISSKHEDVKLKIYPALSPIDYGSAVLGAPLNDFVAIDLNNPIVSSDELENKIKFAVENDFVLFIHNLKGNALIDKENGENTNFNTLKEIIMDLNDDLLVGIVNSNHSYEICQFKDIEDENIKRDSTLIIGNRLTYKLEDYMITSSDYIVKPKFISQNMDFFERYLRDETPKGLDLDCDYLPCHKKLEACDFCYCPFYPCADGITGGEWIKGKNVWSCQYCDWIHLEGPCKAIREGLDDILKEPNDLKAKHIELLKLRRECLLKTLK